MLPSVNVPSFSYELSNLSGIGVGLLDMGGRDMSRSSVDFRGSNFLARWRALAAATTDEGDEDSDGDGDDEEATAAAGCSGFLVAPGTAAAFCIDTGVMSTGAAVRVTSVRRNIRLRRGAGS